MQFHVQLLDDPAAADERRAHVEAHWEYFDAHRENFIARGATLTDDRATYISSVIFVEFDSWEAVRNFIDNEPLNRNGVYREIFIRRWNNALGRLQRDFPRREGQDCWYIRGYGKPGMHDRREELLAAHRDYFAPYDPENFIARGPVLSDDGAEWQGSANLISLPSRADVERFLDDEPYFKNGLYERVLVERFKFGGRPGQIV